MRTRVTGPESEEAAMRELFPNDSATYYYTKYFREGGIWQRLYQIARQHPINYSEGRLAKYFIEGVDYLWNRLMDYIYHADQPDLVPAGQMRTVRGKVEKARTRLTRRGVIDYLGDETHTLHCVDMEFSKLGIDLLGE